MGLGGGLVGGAVRMGVVDFDDCYIDSFYFSFLMWFLFYALVFLEAWSLA